MAKPFRLEWLLSPGNQIETLKVSNVAIDNDRKMDSMVQAFSNARSLRVVCLDQLIVGPDPFESTIGPPAVQSLSPLM
jgi:hypothetical protein